MDGHKGKGMCGEIRSDQTILSLPKMICDLKSDAHKHLVYCILTFQRINRTHKYVW